MRGKKLNSPDTPVVAANELQEQVRELEARAARLEADLAARARVETQLRNQLGELSDFVENATEGLHRVGPDGTILWANQAELNLLGYEAHEYIGRNIAEFHADAPVIGGILNKLTQGQKLYDEPARLRAKDGSIREVLIHSSVLFDEGRFVHTRCFTRDVTRYKHAERELRENEQRYRSLMQQSPFSVQVFHPTGAR